MYPFNGVRLFGQLLLEPTRTVRWPQSDLITGDGQQKSLSKMTAAAQEPLRPVDASGRFDVKLQFPVVSGAKR